VSARPGSTRTPVTIGARLARQTVGVIGSGTLEHDEYARPVGEMLADLGVNLLTGGGRGVMTAVSRAFIRRRRDQGICIGILPCESESERATPKTGYPNEFVELAIRTHLPLSGPQGLDDLSRNHINVLSCAALVALPGESGTAAEASLAVRYGRPVMAFGPRSGWLDDFPASVPRATRLEDVRQFLDAQLDAT
jgi:uncharacterized protein (TIGR00725 family)